MHKTKSGWLLTALLFALGVNPVALAEQVKLNNQQILDYLTDRTVTGNQNGNGWKQFFRAGGSTDYYQDGYPFPSQGYWKAEGDKYCSQWPPSPHWTCYDFTADGDELVFIPPGGEAPWPATRLPE